MVARFILASVWLATVIAGAPPVEPPAHIATLRDLRRLTGLRLEAAPTVSVTGIVTFVRSAPPALVLQDTTDAATVASDDLRGLTSWPAIGEIVAVHGVAAAGRLSPVIRGGPEGLRVERLGRTNLPPALPVAPKDLLGGRHEHRRVEIEGMVRAVHAQAAPPRAEIGTGIGRITLLLPSRDSSGPLVDPLPEGARVRIRGVVSSIVNPRGQWVGCILHAAAWGDIEILAPPLAPEELPLSSIAEIARWGTAGADSPPIRLRGVVLAVEKGHRLFVRDGSGSTALYFGSQGPTAVAAGDEIEAVGYPILVDKRWILQDVALRHLRRVSVPTPVDLDRPEADPALHDADLVRLTGTVLEYADRHPGFRLLLQTSHGPADVDVPHEMAAAPAHDARVEATGIAEVVTRMTSAGVTETVGLRILALPPGGVRILRPAPWWTPRRLWTAIAVASGGMLWFAAWALGLRRIVRRQAARLRESIRAEAVWQERTRIARDIHDDVGAVLTQIAFMCDMSRDEPDPAVRAETVLRIGEAARKAVEALDQIVWTVNPSNDRVDRTVSYCCRIVQSLLEGLPIRCRLDVPNDLPASPIPAVVRHHIAMSVKEAARNAVRHASAGEIRLAARWQPDRLILEIADDGRGLPPGALNASRSGLANIRQRMSEIGGVARFETPGNGGTVVTLEVPLTPEPTIPNLRDGSPSGDSST